jgi:hypothetical protein
MTVTPSPPAYLCTSRETHVSQRLERGKVSMTSCALMPWKISCPFSRSQPCRMSSLKRWRGSWASMATSPTARPLSSSWSTFWTFASRPQTPPPGPSSVAFLLLIPPPVLQVLHHHRHHEVGGAMRCLSSRCPEPDPLLDQLQVPRSGAEVAPPPAPGPP